MTKFVSEVGLRYIEGLRSPVAKDDTEAKKIAVELPDVPLLIPEDNPCKWDLVFVCSDGIIYAHRLVVSNASKYIMHMLDDQPPWYTTYIHVLDLPSHIVQLLVDLAYTGEMRLTEELQSDVIDAMHTLGWVHTDCLSADYDVDGETYAYNADLAKSPKIDQDKQAPGGTNGKETVVKIRSTKSPPRPNARDKNVNEDDMMEIAQLSDVDCSEIDNKAPVLSSPSSNSREKRGSRGVKNTTKTKVKADRNAVSKKPLKDLKKPSASTRKSSRRGSFSETSESGEQSLSVADVLEPTILEVKNKSPADDNIKTIKGKSPTKSKVEETFIDEISQSSQVSSVSEGNSILNSPGKRQRRKPKRFEEYEELEKPKARPSPTKSITETKIARGRKSVKSSIETIVDPVVNNDIPNTKECDESSQDEVESTESRVKTPVNESGASSCKSQKNKTVSRNRSTETAKHSLITSYFTKKDSIKEEKMEMSDSNLSGQILMTESDCNNELDTNDNKMPLSSTSILEDNIERTATNKTSLRKKLRMDSTDEDEVSEVDEKRDSKKRSFDDIRSSHIEETTVSGSIAQENGDESAASVDKKPARKSSRVASKAQSTDENEVDEENAPKRKRIRKESTDANINALDTANPEPPPTTGRRSSKQ